jgi:UDP-glucuronate 4-epimerase
LHVSLAALCEADGPTIRVFVTGCAGFIGSTLVKELLTRGHEVVGIDSLTDYYDASLKRANIERLNHERFTMIVGDLRSYALEPLLKEPFDAIFHLAGQPGVRASWGSEFSGYTTNNIDATQRVLEAVLRSGHPTRVIYASSSSVYGQAETYPTSENVTPRPFSPYGVTKLAGEHLVGLYRENFDLDTTSFRFFTVYGPRQRPDMAFTRFLKAAVAGEPVGVFGSGEQIRDFTYVDDIVSALIQASVTKHPLPRVMNLSGGSSVSVNEIIETIGEIVHSPVNVRYETAVKGDVTRTGGDSTLAKDALGWIPTVTLAVGLNRQLDWVRTLRD